MKKFYLLLLLPVIVNAQNASVEASRAWKKKEGHNIIANFTELLSIPNRASDLPNIRKNAELISKMFSDRGFQMQLLEIEGSPPAVYGEKKVLNAQRTICFYVHYDGQPVDPSSWSNAPFQPVLYDKAMYAGGQPIAMPKANQAIEENWRIYARSASDDKAPIIALIAAIDALKAVKIDYTSNIKFFFDGEEEAGSPHVTQFFNKYSSLFKDINFWLLVDGPVFQTGAPTLKFGGRGFTGLEITVYGATRPLHSGHYGNYAPVPGQMLASLLASMKDEKGKVLIAGYYDSVDPVSDFEREQIKKIPNIEKELKADLGLMFVEGDNETLFERLLLPSLTVKGLQSGNVGSLARNVIPNTAIANLGLRLVKGNDPEKMLDLVEAHIKKQGFHIVYEEPDLEIRRTYQKIVKVARSKSGSPAAKVSMDHPELLPVIQAVKSFTGDDLVLLPSEGGSNGVFTAVFDGLGQPGISVNIANHDNNQHAEDENIRIGNLWYGIDLMSVLLTMPGGNELK
jgi:acetylornithine deacetylase/succinyl-diaminopimelate desuccinylase-like protein